MSHRSKARALLAVRADERGVWKAPIEAIIARVNTWINHPGRDLTGYTTHTRTLASEDEVRKAFVHLCGANWGPASLHPGAEGKGWIIKVYEPPVRVIFIDGTAVWCDSQQDIEFYTRDPSGWEKSVRKEHGGGGIRFTFDVDYLIGRSS